MNSAPGDDPEPPVFDVERYDWSAEGGPSDGRYLADFEEALATDDGRVPALVVYDVDEAGVERVGSAAVRTDDVPALSPGRFERGSLEVTVRDGRFAAGAYSEELTEARVGEVGRPTAGDRTRGDDETERDRLLGAVEPDTQREDDE